MLFAFPVSIVSREYARKKKIKKKKEKLHREKIIFDQLSLILLSRQKLIKKVINHEFCTFHDQKFKD